MSNTFGTLFGNKDKPIATSTSPYANLPKFAQDAFKQSITSAQGFTPEQFTTAPLTAQQNQAIGYFQDPTQAITPEQFQSGLSIFSNPFEEQVLQNTIRDINEQARGGWSDIASYASDVGGFGSDRRGVLEAELQKNLLRTIGDISASSRASNFENASAKTLAEIGNVRNLDFSKMGSLFDIGSLLQEQNTQNKNAPVALNSYLASLVQGLPTAAGTQTRDTGLLGHPFLTSFAQGAGQGAAAGSDRRLKENINHVGYRNGFNIYEFGYKGHQGRWRGVMADEVQKVRPDAVTIINGFLHVFYDLIGIKMEAVNA